MNGVALWWKLGQYFWRPKKNCKAMDLNTKTSEKKSLSYALNRAKRCFKKDGKPKLIELIRQGQIQVRAEKIKVRQADKCLVFGLIQQNFLPKQPHFQMDPLEAKQIGQEFEPDDRTAYEIAYHQDRTTIQNDDYATYRGADNIFVWLGLQEVENRTDCVVDFSDYNASDDLEEFTVDLDFGPDFESVKFLNFLELPKKYMKYSNYRCDCIMSLVEAGGLTCLKSQIDEFFPHSTEHRTSEPNRPLIIDKDQLHRYLDELFISDQTGVRKQAALRRAIRRYTEDNGILAEKGGPSDSTIDNYRKRYLDYLDRKPKK